MSRLCPYNPDEIAESSVMGTISDEEYSQFAWHLAHCQQCRRILALNLRYVPAMREAAKRYASKRAAKKEGVHVAGAAGS